jgi:predicted O-linked N-acetylglucosamine transferase (SPINDLY family)
MGVPVVTLRGETPISRSAASVLTGAGAKEWIAESADDYVAAATALASSGPRTRDAREALRARFAASAAMDEATYTRDVEAAYRRMWTRWCSS